MSGSRVIRLSMLTCAIVMALDLVIGSRVGLIFETGFVLVCVAAALAVRPSDFFAVGVLPPMLLAGCSAVLSLVARSSVADNGDGFIQGFVSALAHSAGALAGGYGLTLVVLATRHQVAHKRRQRHSNRAGSPAPRLTTSGAPDEKSTTVVGSEPHSPESTTASNQ
jgi:hypothetical protein